MQYWDNTNVIEGLDPCTRLARLKFKLTNRIQQAEKPYCPDVNVN